METSIEERWVPVVGFEGIYEVSDRGRVRSLPRIINRVRGGPLPIQGRFLKPGTVESGHLVVALWRDNVGKSCNIHILVAAAFLPPAPAPGLDIDHEDRNPANNHWKNLRWATRTLNNLNRDQSGDVGVTFNAECGRRPWGAFIRQRCIGRFAEKSDALEARRVAYESELALFPK